jgi:uncharacterized protein (DUF58 family)
MWFRRYWFPVPLAVGAIGLAIGSGPLIALAAFMLLAGGLARMWSDHALDSVHYERLMPENRGFVGEQLSVTLRLANDKLLPVPWVDVRDVVPEEMPVGEERLAPSGQPNHVFLRRSTHLGWYERVNWPLQLDLPARGFYRMGPARLASGDIFGFFPVEEESPGQAPIIVYPTTYALPDLGLPADRPFGDSKGRNRLFEDPSRFTGLRDYRPGDSMRRIDWKASARHQALQSRVYEPSSTLNLLLAVNVDTMAHSWQGYVPETLERILSVAGSVARYALESGYAAGLVANGAYPTADRPLRVPVGSRPEQLTRILEALAVIGPLTMTSLPMIIEREAHAFPFGATLVCVTAQMDEALAAALTRVRGSGHHVLVLSLAEEPFTESIGAMPVTNVLDAVMALEARARAGATSG